jgi:hypothetical protein
LQNKICLKIKNENNDEVEEELIKYSENNLLFFIENIKLISKLCFGRNNNSIQIIKNKIHFDVILECIINNKLKTEIRNVFIELLESLYIDIKPFQKKNKFIEYTRVK